MTIILAESLVDRRPEVFPQLLELAPQLRRRQLLIHHAGKLARAKPPQVGGEEIHLQPPQPVALHRVVGNLLQMPRQAAVVQLAEVLEFLAGEPARAGQPVVEIDRQP